MPCSGEQDSVGIQERVRKDYLPMVRMTPPRQPLPWDNALTEGQIGEINWWRFKKKREPGVTVEVNPVTQEAEVIVSNPGQETFWIRPGKGWGVEEILTVAREVFEKRSQKDGSHYLDFSSLAHFYSLPKNGHQPSSNLTPKES